jgi:hypothetical protein
MTSAAGRRLAKLEGALAPREAVLAWLVDAQQFPSLADHARSIAELPVEAAPLSVIGERVEASVRASMKGQPHDAVLDAVRRAIGDGVFLFALALLVNTETLEFAKVEGLRASAVFYWMGALLGGPRAADLPPTEAKVYVRELADAWTLWRSVVDRLSVDVQIERETRAILQHRYFGGRDVFFADASQAWLEQVDLVERLVSLGSVLSRAGAAPTKRRRRSEGRRAVDARVAERVARLVDDARVRAYEILGDRPKAVAIMERRLLAD